MFFKINVLKSFAIFTVKYMCLSLFLIKFQAWRFVFFFKKRLQHRCFPVNIAKSLRTPFFYRTPLVHCTFRTFYVMIEIFGRLWTQNWHYTYFFCHCVGFLYICSVTIGSPRLFRTCFQTKILNKSNFHTYYNVCSSTKLIESLKFRNNSRIIATSRTNLLWKTWIWVFRILYFVIIFL